MKLGRRDFFKLMGAALAAPLLSKLRKDETRTWITVNGNPVFEEGDIIRNEGIVAIDNEYVWITGISHNSDATVNFELGFPEVQS